DRRHGHCAPPTGRRRPGWRRAHGRGRDQKRRALCRHAQDGRRGTAVMVEVKARVVAEPEKVSWKTKLIESPDAVIYYGLPSTLGVASSDVLVLVPGGYAQAMIDGACLPQGSSLIGV